MTKSHVAEASQERENEVATADANRHALEFCFVVVGIVLVLAAFLEALTYQLVSSRTPFVIMVPLLLLLIIQLVRLTKAGGPSQVSGRVSAALSGQIPAFNKKFLLLIWFAVLLFIIALAGHYAGLAVFIFTLTWLLSKERLLVSAAITLGTITIIFAVFEVGFDIELYRGMIFRYLAGYRVF